MRSVGRARLGRRLRSPALQFTAAVAVMVAGAWLIALWAIGLVLVVAGGALGADALWREDRPAQPVAGGHDAVIERWRQAK